jgi:hypothetical protein
MKILQSLCVSHKIVETYRNQHEPKFSKGKMGMMRQWQHWLISSQDVTPSKNSQNIGQAPWAFDRMDMCTIQVYRVNLSINVLKSKIERNSSRLLILLFFFFCFFFLFFVFVFRLLFANVSTLLFQNHLADEIIQTDVIKEVVLNGGQTHEVC